MKLLGSVFTVLLPQIHAQLGGILDDAKYAEKYGQDWKSKKINVRKKSMAQLNHIEIYH